MRSKTDVRLTPSQRLNRGLKYAAVGPVDVTRGTVGLSWQGARSAAGSVHRRIDKSRLAKELGDAQDTITQEFAAAQEVLATLPQVISDARKPKRRRRPLVLAAVGAVVLARRRGGLEAADEAEPQRIDFRLPTGSGSIAEGVGDINPTGHIDVRAALSPAGGATVSEERER